MTLRRLSAHNFRNLKAVDIELSPQLNIFYGDNGSGKTSILEAISTLSLGRSFRSRKFKTMINYDADAYTVFGRVNLNSHEDQPATLLPIGVQRTRQGEVLIKKGGQPCASAAELAEALPIRVMNGHSFSLLEGAPLVRRQFLDWLVFHVEHDFFPVWHNYEKCLKHRNSLLRRGKIDPVLITPWDRELSALASRLDSFRQQAFDRLQPVFSRLLEGFEGLEQLSLRYYRGWDAEQDFWALLEQTRARDLELGYTLQGAHRADVRIMAGKTAAVDVLSRGQQKIVVSALLIAQGMVYTEQRQRRCVYLIDDLPAELDEHFRRTLAGWLRAMGGQVFVTGVEKPPLLTAWQPWLANSTGPGRDPAVEQGAASESDVSAGTRNGGQLPVKVFHVKHGCVEPE